MKKILICFTAFFLLVGACSILPIHGEAGIYDNVIRLHVLANSDSERDQALKLSVRDAVLQRAEPLLQGVSEKGEAEAVLRASLDEIKAAAEGELRRQGAENTVTVTLGLEEYPTRRYESLAFPAGEYLSLRVMIGEAEGQNWWCVLFPPLCLTAAAADSDSEAVCLSAGISGEQYRVIANTDSTKYRLRFKLLEVAKAWFE